MKKIYAGLLTVTLGLAMWAGCESAQTDVSPLTTTVPLRLQPGPNDARIAHVTARLLEEYHYSQHPLDTELSKRFFDGYIDALDPRHEDFLQSDLAEFDVYRTNLDKLTLEHGTADLTPAFAVYDRFAERMQQHVAYVDELLKLDKFKFTDDEKILIDRRHAPFPKDLDEAKALWGQRLRYEYLQEKLSREITETNNNLVIKLPADADKEIAATLERHYRWTLHMTTNWDSDGVLQAYLNGLAHAYDPHSDYFNTSHAKDFAIGMNLSLFGIGAQLSEDDGYCTIRSLVPGGPAAKSKKVNEKDRIVAVAQGDKPAVNVVDMDLEKVVQQIRGNKGTEVRLTISPADDRAARRVVTLVRDEIELEDSEAKAKLMVFPDGKRIGIIDLPSFYATVNLGSDGQTTPKSTTDDVTKLINRLKQEKISGLIVDLRFNPGGSLEEAIRFTGLFIKDGPIVQARNPDGQVQVDSDPDPTQLYDGPLVVMINRYSASAAEIAAAALQDYGRALIVGDTSTHGKGTVQNLNPLKPYMLPKDDADAVDPGNLKITIRKFYRVSGASTQLKGVVPDIVLPDVLNYYTQIGETSLEHPLPWDTIQPVIYDKLNLVKPFLAQLETDSDKRLVTNQDFLYVKQDIEQFQKEQADKTVTINEHDALKEREHNFAQNKAREAERAARKPDDVKTYDITVENAGKPGLTEAGADNETNAVTITTETNSNTITLVSNKPGQTNATMTAATNAANVAVMAEKKTAPVFDPMLDETERILQDYIAILTKNGSQIAHQ